MRCSSGYDSIVLNITPKDVIKISLDDCNSVDLEYTTSNGNLQFVYYSSVVNSVKTMVNVNLNDIVTLEIPKFILYSITDSQCNISNDVMVLVKGEVKSVKLQIMKIQIQ